MIYLDHAATTPVLPEVEAAMKPFFKEKYGNPSSAYNPGEECRKEIERVREFIAESIHAHPEEIYFTSGGTESDNWALKGIRKNYINDKVHYITSCIEHHAILHSCASLCEEHTDVTYVAVDETGEVDMDRLRSAIKEDTVLVSVMYANNETGRIQPVKNVGYLCKEHNILFHTDAVQVYGHLPIDVEEEKIDLLSASAHKFGGPKGVGFLYVREGISLSSILDGGGQERGKRAGTENVAGIAGMREAARLSFSRMEEDNHKIIKMRDYLEEGLLSTIPYARINGKQAKPDFTFNGRLPGHLNISFQFINGFELVAMLSGLGICVSSGSACSAGSSAPSHVLSAMHVPPEYAAGSIRITIGRENTMEEMEQTLISIRRCVEYLRKKSSSYEDFFLANCNLL